MLLKMTFLTFLALAQSGASLAEFRGGRVQPESYSEMRTVRAGGIFEGRRNARVEMNFEDGLGAPVSITLRAPGMEPAVLPMVKIAPTDCGDHYVAILGDAQSFVTTRLELTDYSTIRCRIFVAMAWEVKVMHSDDDGKLSEWLLEGSPEQLLRAR